MAITNQRTNASPDTGSTTIELVDGVGSNRRAVAMLTTVHWDPATIPIGLILNGVAGAVVAVGGGNPDGQQALACIWDDDDLPAAAGTYTVTHSGGSGQHAISAWAASGVKQAAPVGVVSSIGYTAAREPTVSGDAGFVAFLADCHNGSTVTVANTTLVNAPGGNNTYAHSYAVGSGAMSHVHSILEYNAYVAFGVEPAAAGGGDTALAGDAADVATATGDLTTATPLAGSATAESAATGALTRPTLTVELRDIDTGALKNAVTYAEVYVFLDGVGLLSVLTNITTSALGIMTLRDVLFDQLGSTYHLIGYTADWSDRFHADAILADG